MKKLLYITSLSFLFVSGKSQEYVVIGDTSIVKIFSYDKYFNGDNSFEDKDSGIINFNDNYGFIFIKNIRRESASAVFDFEYNSIYSSFGNYFAIETKYDTLALVVTKYDTVTHKEYVDTIDYIYRPYNTPKVYKIGDTIFSNIVFTNVECDLYRSENRSIHWQYNAYKRLSWLKEDYDKYMALQFQRNNKKYYGWLSLDVLGWNSTHIKHIAVPKALLPETSIRTKEIVDFSYSIFPNPVKNKLTIYLEEGDLSRKILISSLTGLKVYEKVIRSNMELIDMSVFSNGIYILEILQGSKSVKCKLIKQ